MVVSNSQFRWVPAYSAVILRHIRYLYASDIKILVFYSIEESSSGYGSGDAAEMGVYVWQWMIDDFDVED